MRTVLGAIVAAVLAQPVLAQDAAIGSGGRAGSTSSPIGTTPIP